MSRHALRLNIMGKMNSAGAAQGGDNLSDTTQLSWEKEPGRPDQALEHATGTYISLSPDLQDGMLKLVARQQPADHCTSPQTSQVKTRSSRTLVWWGEWLPLETRIFQTKVAAWLISGFQATSETVHWYSCIRD